MNYGSKDVGRYTHEYKELPDKVKVLVAEIDKKNENADSK
jgi:hypothetical protein